MGTEEVPAAKESVMKSDIFIKHHQYSLRILDAWPAAGSLPVFYLSVGITMVFLVFEIWNVTDVYDDLEVLMDNLISTIGVISGLSKIITLRLKRRKVRSVVSSIFEDWELDDKSLMNETMVENCTRSQLISRLIVLLYNAMNFTYFLRTFVSYMLDPVQERKFVAQVTFPFDGRQSPAYELIIVGQFITASLCFNSQALIEGLLVTSVLHACAKADMVREEIARFSKVCQANFDDHRSTLVTLRRLMRKHKKFIEFADSIQDIFSFIAFFHTCYMTLLQVVAGYMFIDGIERGMKLVNFIHYALVTCSIIISSGFYCVIGEYLTSQSEIIFRELCDCSWYHFPTVHKKSMYFMLAKAVKPVNITVGKFRTAKNKVFFIILLTMLKKTVEMTRLIVIKLGDFGSKMNVNDIFIAHHQIGLKFIGAWPGFARLWGFFVIQAWSWILLFFAFWNIAVVYTDLDMLMDNLVSTIGTVMGLLKLTTLRLKRSTFVVMINKMMDDWCNRSKEAASEKLVENISRSKLVSKSIIILYNTMHFTYVLKTIISYLFDAVEDRKYLAAVTFPVDGKQTPIFEIVFVSQFILAFTTFNIHALIEGLLATSVIHACSKVEFVRMEISRFSKVCRLNFGDKRAKITSLRDLVRIHVKFIHFSEDVQNVFCYISFFHIFFLTLIQVLSGYMFIETLERGGKAFNVLHYATLTIAFLVSAGYYCIAGEYLTNQSELIFRDLYDCLWYEFKMPEQKAVSFMLVKAEKPVTLMFGKFSDLSLIYLTKIMKTSFSYLSLVRAVR